jgi:hypothetical protein
MLPDTFGGPTAQRVDVGGLTVVVNEGDLMVCVRLGGNDVPGRVGGDWSEPTDMTGCGPAVQGRSRHMDVDQTLATTRGQFAD